MRRPMITVDILNAEKMREYCLELQSWFEPQSQSFISFEYSQISNYFSIMPRDKFLSVNYSGAIADLPSLHKYVNFPGKSCGQLIVIKSTNDIRVDEMYDINNECYKCFRSDTYEPIMGTCCEAIDEEINLTLITKTFLESDISDKAVFHSLWKAVLLDLNMQDDAGFYEAILKTRYKIAGDSIIMDKLTSIRCDIIFDLKKKDFEKNIRIYTGREWNLSQINADSLL